MRKYFDKIKLMEEKNLLILKNCTVLIVDDDESLLQDLFIILNIFFEKVYTVRDGEEALEVFNNNHIDVIFTDYVMPKLNGYELIKKIREVNSKIPIVTLTSYNDQKKLMSLIDMNLTSYILKPYNFIDITKSLNKIVKNVEEYSLHFKNLNNGLIFNSKTRVLYKDDKIINLSKNEILLVELFLNNPNEIISQERIDDKLSPNKPLSYQASKNIIYRLRKKIGLDFIQSIQSVGYIYKLKEDL